MWSRVGPPGHKLGKIAGRDQDLAARYRLIAWETCAKPALEGPLGDTRECSAFLQREKLTGQHRQRKDPRQGHVGIIRPFLA